MLFRAEFDPLSADVTWYMRWLWLRAHLIVRWTGNGGKLPSLAGVRGNAAGDT